MQSLPESGHLRPPKKVTIVFIGDHRKKGIGSKLSIKKKFQFHKFACAHLLVQMNSAQNLFVFQVLFGDGEDGFNFPKEMNEEKDETDGQSFCEEINEFKEKQEKGWDETDHWIGITSKKIIVPNKTRENKYIYKVSREGARSNVYLITSRDWEREYCPPSLFEYLVLAVFMCSGRSLIDDLLKHAGTGIPPDPHNSISMTGCICDNNTPQDEWRIRISNPSLCFPCRARLTRIEEKIPGIHLVEQIDNILSRKWMGSPNSRDTPLYNLRKNYGHNVDHNSGFDKKFSEILRDSFRDNLVQWLLGIAGSIITAVILVHH